MACSRDDRCKCKLLSEFKNFKKLGSGGYGLVVKAKGKNDKTMTAIKLISTAVDIDKEKALEEVRKIALTSGHDSVVRFIAAWGDNFTPDEYRTFAELVKPNKKDKLNSFPPGQTVWEIVAIQMEVCDGGDLKTWLKKQKKVNFPENILILLQIARGIEYLHSLKLIHRDLKPANILFKGKNVKIGDLGWSVVHTAGDYEHTSHAGAKLYQAPEQAHGHYGQTVDYYALGLILYELFYPAAQVDVGKAIIALKNYRNLPEELKQYPEFVSKLIWNLTLTPEVRPNCAKIAEVVNKFRKEFPNMLELSNESINHEDVSMASEVDVKCNNCFEILTASDRFCYKCSICLNFFICQTCKNSHVHPPAHTLLKIESVADDKSGCRHYKRGCKLQCSEPTCKRFFFCRFCHDTSVRGHRMDRFKIDVIQCTECGMKQHPRQKCLLCDAMFGYYSCLICNLYENSASCQLMFHCIDCGFCRKRENGYEFYKHCDNCSQCFPEVFKNSNGRFVIEHICPVNAESQ